MKLVINEHKEFMLAYAYKWTLYSSYARACNYADKTFQGQPSIHWLNAATEALFLAGEML